MADSSFWHMFLFPLLSGDKNHLFSETNAIVLTRSLSMKLFGKLAEPGQVVKVSGHNFVVRGIMNDLTDNTIFAGYDPVINFPVLAQLWGSPELLTTNGNNSFNLFVKLSSHSRPEILAGQILDLFHENGYWL